MAAEWLSVAETAEYLHLHRSTVYRHLQDGTLPCQSMRIGRVWRIRADDVDQLRRCLASLLKTKDPATGASVLNALVGQ